MQGRYHTGFLLNKLARAKENHWSWITYLRALEWPLRWRSGDFGFPVRSFFFLICLFPLGNGSTPSSIMQTHPDNAARKIQPLLTGSRIGSLHFDVNTRYIRKSCGVYCVSHYISIFTEWKCGYTSRRIQRTQCAAAMNKADICLVCICTVCSEHHLLVSQPLRTALLHGSREKCKRRVLVFFFLYDAI